ncbi:MAG: TetR family transcriptional regulator [Phycisphaerae bacterium]|nr:MAG: TetR family transcriptional regulator [Phycisphaerae bacterium]
MNPSKIEITERLLTLPEIPRQGRERIIGTAIALFYRHGINAVGLDRILSEVGVSKTTFYKHFESKDELVVVALQERDRWEMDAWKHAVVVMAGDDPRDQLMGLIDILDVLFQSEEFRGCQFINAAAEFPNPCDPIHKAAAAHKLANWEMVRVLAKSAGSKDPESFADAFTLVFEGTLILRQVHVRDDAASAARPVIQKLIDDHLPRKTD